MGVVIVWKFSHVRRNIPSDMLSRAVYNKVNTQGIEHRSLHYVRDHRGVYRRLVRALSPYAGGQWCFRSVRHIFKFATGTRWTP